MSVVDFHALTRVHISLSKTIPFLKIQLDAIYPHDFFNDHFINNTFISVFSGSEAYTVHLIDYINGPNQPVSTSLGLRDP